MVGANRECSLPSSPFFESVACDPFAFMQASDSVPASVIMAEAQLKVAFAACQWRLNFRQIGRSKNRHFVRLPV